MRNIKNFEEHLNEGEQAMEDPAPMALRYQIFKFVIETGETFKLRFTNDQGTEAVISDISIEESLVDSKQFSRLHNEGPVIVSGRGRFEMGSEIKIEQLFDEYGERLMSGDEPLILTATGRVKSLEEME
jgi:hypothetical protein